MRALNDKSKQEIMTRPQVLTAAAGRLGQMATSCIGARQMNERLELMRQLELIKPAGVKFHAPRLYSKETGACPDLLA